MKAIALSALLTLIPLSVQAQVFESDVPPGRYVCLNQSGQPAGYEFDLYENGVYIGSNSEQGNFATYRGRDNIPIIAWQSGPHRPFDNTVFISNNDRESIVFRIANRRGGVVCVRQ